ncbi:MAG TPA: helix-turn-helix transcriptional regulator, partial [Caulobacteraceae bacterium]
MTIAFAEEVTYVRELGHLSEQDVAAATGVARSTVNAWVRGSRQPTGERAARIAELSALVERLVRVMEPSYVAVWLHKPLPALGDDKALEVLARGDYRRLSALVAELESPV